MVKVFLVDDNPFVRKVTRQLLELEPGIQICGEAGTADSALELLEEIKPSIALIDISLDGNEQGIELIKIIRGKGYKFPILTISLHEEAVYAERVMKAGGQGYLMKQDAPEHLIRAIRYTLSKGNTFFTHCLSEALQDS